MALRYAEVPVDIHGGGRDLIFPHHESEIAQAECATGVRPFARWWVHVGMIRYRGEKMSKSLGNLVMVRDLLARYSADALRLYLGGHHYREVWGHSQEELAEAQAMADRLRIAIKTAGGRTDPLEPSTARAAFTAALDDDLDTPAARGVLASLAEEIIAAARAGRDVTQAQGALREMGRVFGLRLDSASPERRVMAGWNEHLKRFR